LHLITLHDTHSVKTPLNEKSATSRGPYLHKTPHSQKTNTHAPAKIRTQSAKKRAIADLLLRPRGHRDRLVPLNNKLKIYKDNNLLITRSMKFIWTYLTTSNSVQIWQQIFSLFISNKCQQMHKKILRLRHKDH